MDVLKQLITNISPATKGIESFLTPHTVCIEGIHDTFPIANAMFIVLKKKFLQGELKDLTKVEIFNISRALQNLQIANSVKNEYTENAQSQAKQIKEMLKSNSIYKEAAFIADDVYHPGREKLVGGWRLSNDYRDLQYSNEECGLVSALYERNLSIGKQYIYATAGTNPLNMSDWGNNIYQVCGYSEQYDKALGIAKVLSCRIEKDKNELIFVGHSLGGGEATNNALATGHKAIVFNPAGLSSDTMSKNTIEDINTEEIIECFIADNDVLNWMQDCAQNILVWKNLVPAAIGRRYYLPLTEKDKHPIGHLMKDIISYFNEVCDSHL